MVDFGGNASEAVVALCAAMTAIVIWATAASFLGIPTSESHALIAGISGAAIALQGSLAGINGSEWIKGDIRANPFFNSGLQSGLHHYEAGNDPL